MAFLLAALLEVPRVLQQPWQQLAVACLPVHVYCTCCWGHTCWHPLAAICSSMGRRAQCWQERVGCWSLGTVRACCRTCCYPSEAVWGEGHSASRCVWVVGRLGTVRACCKPCKYNSFHRQWNVALGCLLMRSRHAWHWARTCWRPLAVTCSSMGRRAQC
jgi:hypothetical protein